MRGEQDEDWYIDDNANSGRISVLEDLSSSDLEGFEDYEAENQLVATSDAMSLL